MYGILSKFPYDVDSPDRIRHVLIDCIDLDLIRPRFYTVPDMKTLFDTVSVDRILAFVKEVKEDLKAVFSIFI